MIAHRLQRLRSLLRRYRVDGRLPPPVWRLYRETSLLRFRDRGSSLVGTVLPPLGDSAVSTSMGAYGARRLATAGPLSQSLFDLGHDVAGHVTSALSAAGVDHFVVDRRGDGLEFGVELPNRNRAAAALAAIDLPGWYLEWSAGTRSGIKVLSDASTDSHVRRAREWRAFQAFSWGADAVGADQGAVISFWEIGTSGLLEKVGVRGQERFDARSPHTVELVDGRRYPGRSAFPVGANLEHVEDPIDIVYTWVDGSDPDWREAFRRTAAAVGRTVDEVALDPARFHSRDELRYSLRSVWAHCGWVRTIWIVTAGQRPDWLADDPRVRIVDHSDILPADALPTFNSHAIEAALHRIDGLAEQFVYLNDDVLVRRSIRPEVFFNPAGLPRVFQSTARPPGFEDGATEAIDAAALRGRELLESTFGKVASGKPYHSAFPLCRTTIYEIEDRFAEIVERTQHSRFRSPDDLSVAASFAQHYAVATRAGVLDDIATEYINVESGRLGWHLDRIRLDESLVTYCINETHRDGGDHEERERRITEFFDRMLPIAAPWER